MLRQRVVSDALLSFFPRGLFRESADTWQQLPTPPAGSGFDPVSGATRTPLVAPEGGGPLRAQIRVPEAFAPASLGFTLFAPPPPAPTPPPAGAAMAPPMPVGTHYGRTGSAPNAPSTPFCVPLGHDAGSPAPLGASLAPGSAGSDGSVVLNFAVHSRSARSLVLYLQWDGGELELALDGRVNRTGDTWHVALPAGGPSAVLPAPAADGPPLLYGFRAGGAVGGEGALRGERFNAGRVVFDPHAKRLRAPLFAPAAPPGVEPPPLLGDLGALVAAPPDWEADRPPKRDAARSLLYHLDVAAFTAHASAGVAPGRAGTFLGVLDRMPHLLAMGVTTVALAPVTVALPGDDPAAPASLFALDDRFATAPGRAVAELAAMVAGLHAAGIEVLAPLVLSHTAEGVASEPVSLAGLDAPAYFAVEAGGALAPAPPPHAMRAALNPCAAATQSLVLEAARYWASTFRVDGFTLHGGAFAARGPAGRSPLLEALAADAVVGGPGAKMYYVRGPGDTGAARLPHWGVLGETLPAFAADVAAFVHGGQGLMSPLATRLCGSGDVLAPLRSPRHAINCLALPHERSLAAAAAGREPPMDAGEPLGALSEDEHAEGGARARLMLLILFASAGVPALSQGDEFGAARTAAASALRFDDAAGAAPWGVSLARFVAAASEVRLRHADALAWKSFPPEGAIAWMDPLGARPPWSDPAAPAVMAFASAGMPPTVCVCLNGSGSDVTFALPEPPAGRVWRCVLDAAAPPPGDVTPWSVPPDTLQVTVSSPGGMLLESVAAAELAADEAREAPAAAKGAKAGVRRGSRAGANAEPPVAPVLPPPPPEVAPAETPAMAPPVRKRLILTDPAAPAAAAPAAPAAAAPAAAAPAAAVPAPPAASASAAAAAASAAAAAAVTRAAAAPAPAAAPPPAAPAPPPAAAATPPAAAAPAPPAAASAAAAASAKSRAAATAAARAAAAAAAARAAAAEAAAAASAKRPSSARAPLGASDKPAVPPADGTLTAAQRMALGLYYKGTPPPGGAALPPQPPPPPKEGGGKDDKAA